MEHCWEGTGGGRGRRARGSKGREEENKREKLN